MTCIVLTLRQAKQLKQSGEWPGQWAIVDRVPIDTISYPNKPRDPALVELGVDLALMGCSWKQVQLQLQWYGGMVEIKRRLLERLIESVKDNGPTGAIKLKVRKEP